MKYTVSLLGAAVIACTSFCTAQQEEPQSAMSGSEAIAQQQQQKVPDFVLVDKQPELKKSAEPVYPPDALAKNLEGKVWVKVLIDSTGRPAEVQLLKSDNDIFNDAAMAAARQFLFTPALKDNRPVAVWVTFPFRFKLGDDASTSPGQHPAAGKSHAQNQFQDMINQVFAGEPSARALISPEAYLIDGSRYVNLSDAVFGKEKGKCFAGEKSRKWMFTKINLSDDRVSATVVVETVNAKQKEPRWHTIAWTKSAEGDWKITHWHTSR